MSNDSKVISKLDLILCDFIGNFALGVPRSAVCKGVPLYLEVAKDPLEFTENVLNCCTVAGSFEVVDVLGHGGGESATTVAHAQFIVNLTAFHEALFLGDFSQFDGERSWCISQSGAWLVAMQNLILRIKVSKPGSFCNNGILSAGR